MDQAAKKAAGKAYYERVKADPVRYKERLRRAREREAERRATDPEFAAHCSARHQQWIEANKDRDLDTRRARMQRWRFGLAKEEMAAMLAHQSEVCAICGQKQRSISSTKDHGRTDQLAVDHDHATGVIRGLLCASCNHGIAKFLDNPAWLRRAASYLEEPPAVVALGAPKQVNQERMSKIQALEAKKLANKPKPYVGRSRSVASAATTSPPAADAAPVNQHGAHPPPPTKKRGRTPKPPPPAAARPQLDLFGAVPATT